MKIKIVCFSHLSVHSPVDGPVEVGTGAIVSDLPDLLGFDADDVAMYFCGDKRVDPDYALASGDLIKIFPAITGG